MSGVAQLVSTGSLLLAMPVAAAAGAVTFLSPCCLPLVPGFISYVTGMAGATSGKPGSGRPGTGPDSAAGPASAVPATPAAAAAPGADTGLAPGSATLTLASGTVAAPPVAAPPVAAPPRAPSATPATVTASPAPPASPVAEAALTAPAPPPRGRVVAGTLLFVFGFSLVFVAAGAAFGELGHLLTGHAREVTQVLGGVTILLGLLFAGVFDRFTIAGRIVRPSARPKAGLAGAPLLGIMFGLSWTPCIGPTLTAVEGLSAASGTVVRGALLSFIYAFGLGIPFLLVAFGAQRAMRVFAFARRHAGAVTKIGGAMLVIVGLLEVTGAWYTFITWLQVHWADYKAPF